MSRPPKPSATSVETGTVFMNRCDYLDPALTWTGVKDTGRGATLSALGYEAMTRPKSFHLRTTAMTIPNRNFNYPTAIKFGAGRIKELAELCKANGIKRPLFVTDPGLAAMPMVKQIVADVKAADLPLKCFPMCAPIPIEANIIEGVKAYKAGRHDGVIAFGGGSGLDIGKMIALMHGQNYFGVRP